ncbi:MAG: tRNA (adenosine(37)-N6)-threonylcarbamoyltransferase complex ATPase subunit type 1 TsaE [Patescibacteria group bacterium]
MRTVTLSHGQDCFRFSVPTVAAWKDVADYLVPKLKPGDIVTLSGPLGAGKTTFVQILSKEFGVKREPQSPTFALMRSYPITKKGKIKRIVHIDAYRIEHERELLALDLDEELADGKSVLVIEWPERISAWLLRHAGRVYALSIETK